MSIPHRDRPFPAQETATAAAPRSALQAPGAAMPARHARATAQGIVSALRLPAPRPATPQPVCPVPLASLHQLPHDTSMLYDILRVDVSGRIGNHEIVEALHWRPGDNLETFLTQGAIVIRVSADGLFRLPQRRRIIIPAAARRRYGIRPADRVLVAAAPDYGIVIVYPLSTLDEMITRYHSAYPDAETPRT